MSLAESKRRMWVVLGVAMMLVACNSKPAAVSNAASQKATSAKGNSIPDLKDAIDDLGESIKNPTSKLHFSYKRTYSGSAVGAPVHFEVDVSPAGVNGQYTGSRNTTWNATPGTDAWRDCVMTMLMSLPDDKLREAQAGVKYVDDENTGGFQTGRYDFDLNAAPRGSKTGTLLGANAVSGMVGGGAGTKDFNVKGSAWVTKDGRMVKFQFDYIILRSDGAQLITHYDGAINQ